MSQHITDNLRGRFVKDSYNKSMAFLEVGTKAVGSVLNVAARGGNYILRFTRLRDYASYQSQKEILDRDFNSNPILMTFASDVDNSAKFKENLFEKEADYNSIKESSKSLSSLITQVFFIAKGIKSRYFKKLPLEGAGKTDFNVAPNSTAIDNLTYKLLNKNIPKSRLKLHKDLLNRGYTSSGTSKGGYVTYKKDGLKVDIRPDGEVIFQQKVKVNPNDTAWNARTYWQRTNYDGSPVPNGGHNTYQFVESIDNATILPPKP